MHDITITFTGKKIGHTLSPGTFSARMLKTRFNRAGNLEMTLTNIEPVTDEQILEELHRREAVKFGSIK